MEIKTYGALYQALKENGVPDSDIESHCSDMYVRVTDTTVAVVKAYREKHGIESMPATFRSSIDGDGIWFEVSFAYAPFWENGCGK